MDSCAEVMITPLLELLLKRELDSVETLGEKTEVVVGYSGAVGRDAKREAESVGILFSRAVDDKLELLALLDGGGAMVLKLVNDGGGAIILKLETEVQLILSTAVPSGGAIVLKLEILDLLIGSTDVSEGGAPKLKLVTEDQLMLSTAVPSGVAVVLKVGTEETPRPGPPHETVWPSITAVVHAPIALEVKDSKTGAEVIAGAVVREDRTLKPLWAP